jgi:murein DD-endopeptidase MepM/ murein hydrolase activator NlpD
MRLRRSPCRAAAILAVLWTSACGPAPAGLVAGSPSAQAATIPDGPAPGGTPLPTRTAFAPGELLPYEAQSGDTLPAIAAHFNTTIEEIVAANPNIPTGITTLPPRYPLLVPSYYVPFTSLPLKLIPDSEVVNGPSALEFDTLAEVERRTGYLTGLSDYAYRRERPGWEVVDSVAQAYSLHPRLLLTLLEHQTHALTRPFADESTSQYPLGYESTRFRGLFRQLLWVSEELNDGYYGWREGTLREFETADGFIVRPDPWLNAGSVAVQYVLARLWDRAEFEQQIGPQGFPQTYRELWGEDPFQREVEIIPGQLQQPELALPFLPNRIWQFTGGPHSSWGSSRPFGALDFAPPAHETGCAESGEWIAAPADGIITRSAEATLVMDLSGDGDERTGWVLFFYHVSSRDRILAGTPVVKGDRLGHPSCEGGLATGTHFHFARRYNGEWITAVGLPEFVLDGWEAVPGPAAYQGWLEKGSIVVPACECTSQANRILYEFP